MTRPAVLVLACAALLGAPAAAQHVEGGRDARLAVALPPAEAALVRVRAAELRSLGLPGDAVVLRALELAAKGAAPRDVVGRVQDLAGRLLLADLALRLGGRLAPDAEEIVAGADAIASGLAPGQLRALAGESGPGVALTPRLIAIMGLLDRGVPAADALAVVAAHLPIPGRPPHAAPMSGAEPRSPLVPAATGRGRRFGERTPRQLPLDSPPSST